MGNDHEFHLGSGNWLLDSSRARFRSASSTTPTSNGTNIMGGFGWQTEIVDTKARSYSSSSSIASLSASGSTTSIAFQETDDHKLQMMGLGISPQRTDHWNQALLGEKAGDGSLQLMLQEDLNSTSSSTNFQHESGTTIASFQEPFKQTNRHFQFHHQKQFFSNTSADDSTFQGLASGFQVDSSIYGSNIHSSMLQGLFGSDDSPYTSTMNSGHDDDHLLSSWTRIPQFLKASPSKQAHQNQQLRFSNNAPFWNNVSAESAISDFRSGGFDSLQTPQPSSKLNEEAKQHESEFGGLNTVKKKNSSELPSNKRPHKDQSQSTLPAFKVRKEKMGDRITALQQLVSPFGKTDTASVLSEAIEYIKYLHDQVNALSAPYMKQRSFTQNNHDYQSKDPEESKQDLRSRGLCLVPVSITFPVTQETAIEFWTPTTTFGSTFR